MQLTISLKKPFNFEKPSKALQKAEFSEFFIFAKLKTHINQQKTRSDSNFN